MALTDFIYNYSESIRITTATFCFFCAGVSIIRQHNITYHLQQRLLKNIGKVKVHKPAGYCAFIILSFIFSKKVFNNNFAQTIADMRDEANEADALNQSWQRRWIIIRGNISLTLSVVIYLKVQVIKKAWDAFSIGTLK